LVVIWSEIDAQKNALPSRRAVPQVDRCNDKTTNCAMNWFLIRPILRIWPRTLSVPKLKNLARWEEILVKWGSHCRRQWVFYRLWDSLLQIITKRELCVLSGWNLTWRGSKSGSFEMSRHQMDCSAISWKFTKFIKRPTYKNIIIFAD